jgi:environmental stress-induced protein Ves
MAISSLRAASYERVAWKNGGGVTDVVAIAPGERPAWRISIARIEQDGPFSEFGGYDRTIVSLAAGVELAFASGDMRALATFQPFAFRGEDAVEARLSNGPVSDFNVMTLRERCTHRATAIGFGANGVPIGAGDVAGFLYVASGTVEMDANLAYAGDAFRLEANDRAVARAIDGPAMAILVRISASRTAPIAGR